MKLGNSLKRFQGGRQKGQKQMPLAPTILAALLIAVIAYLFCNTQAQRAELDTFSHDLAGVPDLEKRLTLKKDHLTLVNNLNTGQAQVVGGALVLLTAYIGWRNLKAAEDKQVTERFSKAIEHLGHNDVHVRLGGIYALERIAIDSDKDYWQVMEILTAYVRERSSWTREQAEEWAEVKQRQGDPEVPPSKIDIQGVLTVLQRRKHSLGNGEKHPLDLRRTDLRKADLRGANLQKAKLGGANLQEVQIVEANLMGANLIQAHLERAELKGANLMGAYLIDAHLERADLERANLMGTYLVGVNLRRADLRGAKLEGAKLQGADLEGADLEGANLRHTDWEGAKSRHADLRSADLEGANLRRADLESADLRRADLRGAKLEEAENLTQEQVDDAIIDENTTLPGSSNVSDDDEDTIINPPVKKTYL